MTIGIRVNPPLACPNPKGSPLSINRGCTIQGQAIVGNFKTSLQYPDNRLIFFRRISGSGRKIVDAQKNAALRDWNQIEKKNSHLTPQNPHYKFKTRTTTGDSISHLNGCGFWDCGIQTRCMILAIILESLFWRPLCMRIKHKETELKMHRSI